jgi:hypothetical protein
VERRLITHEPQVDRLDLHGASVDFRPAMADRCESTHLPTVGTVLQASAAPR